LGPQGGLNLRPCWRYGSNPYPRKKWRLNDGKG
jgi:hypothetical protein